MLPKSAETPLVHSLADQLDVDDKHMTRRPKNIFIVAIGILLVAVLGSAVFLYFFLYLPGLKIISSAKALKASSEAVAPFIKNQDLGGIQKQLSEVKTKLDAFKSDYEKIGWLKNVPYANLYYLDGMRVTAAAYEILASAEVAIQGIAPYADVIGLKGLSTTGDGAKTAQDRINFIINTLDKLKPQLTQIATHLSAARKEVDQINPNRYPQEFRGIPVREKMTSAINLMDQAESLVTDAAPLLESAPYILGIDSSRKYLVIFQNDAELRPTGGFMTAYAVLSVNKGKISIVQSDDIYALDAKFTKKIPAPDPIKKYLPKVPYWNLRDQNLSPDFKASMDVFHTNYLTTGSPKVDGILSVDTQVLVDLLKITGPIGVPGFGNYHAGEDPRCKCPQVWYELELFADVEGPVVWDSVSGQIVVKPKNYGERKSFIGPMMYSVLANVMAQPKAKIGELFTATMSLFQGKHIQFYLLDSTAQKAVESFNLAGRIREFDGDYLLVADTNFAGAKTNAWVTYTADQKIEVTGDGSVVKTLSLTYKNPQAFFEDKETKLRLNGIFRDWLRVYVPKGSKLLEAKGFETGQTTGEDLDKTVFEGFFTLTPLNTKIITLKYELPIKLKSPYKLLIQKQAGSKNFPYNLTLNGRKHPEILLDMDRELSLAY